MNFIENIKEKAKSNKQTIVLPEATDVRILKAAKIVSSQNLADIILVGEKEDIYKIANEQNIDIENIKIVEPSKDSRHDLYVEEFLKLTKRCNYTKEEADKFLQDPLYFGMMMAKLDEADGLVAGASHSTKQILQPMMQIFRTKNTKLLSTFFIVEHENKDFGNKDYTFLFSDCALNEEPGYLALAEIAKVSARTYEWLFKKQAKVGFLSYSTLGSAKSASTEKVAKAAMHLKKKVPNLICEGELQIDAAIMPEVAKMKSPNGELKGEANVLIFPDINAGNIAYKIFERFSNVRMYGPACQGLEKPINDLSRACSVERVCDTIAITAVQAQEKDNI